MPSTITEPRTTRIRHADLTELERIAREQDSTVSSVMATLIRQGLCQTTAVA
jgi:hypothetical protein